MNNAFVSSLIGFGFVCCLALPLSAAEFPSIDEPASVIGNTLEDFFTAALDYSPRIRIAEESMNIGSARIRASNGQLLPQLNANASLSDNDYSAPDLEEKFKGERYYAQLTQVLFNWQAFSQRNQAYLLKDQLEAEYFAELAALLTDVATKYFDVLHAEDALESIQSELSAVTNQLNLIQSYYDRQLVQITDLYDAQARLAAVQADALDVQSQLALRREALRAVTGVSAGQLFRLSDEVTPPPLNESIEHWVQTARNNSYRIQAAELAQQGAEERISERRGAYMPHVTLVVNQQNSNVGYENRPQAKSDSIYFGVDISIPLFAGGRNRAAVSEANSQRNIAENQLRQVQLDVSERTRTAYLQVISSESRTTAAAKLAESTALSATARQRGFELGTVTSVDVLNALRDQFQAERDLLRTRYEHIKYLLVLKQEAGTLTADDMLEVGSWLTAPEL
ncbi:MAG: TolC family protein [Pseudohongiellaceae bacterium]